MQRIFARLWVLVAFLLLLPFRIHAQEIATRLPLQSGTAVLQAYQSSAASADTLIGEGLWLVEWQNSGSASLIKENEAVAGFRKISAFSPKISLLYAAAETNFKKLHAQFSIKTVAAFRPEWKAQPAWLQSLSGSVDVVVTFPEIISPTRIRKDLEAMGARDLQFSLLGRTLQFKMQARNIPQILAIPYLISAGPATQRVPLNRDSRGHSGAAVLSLAPAQNPLGRSLSGNGVVVGVGDNSAPMTHVDLEEKTINFNPEPPLKHGTHVSGILAGSGIIDDLGKGAAPGAKLLASVYEMVLEKTPQFRQSYGMNLTNNSYAALVGQCNNAGLYDAYSEAIDRLSRTVPDVLHVFAAGNDGSLQCGPAPGYGNIPGSFQTAKNNLTVGNVQKDLALRPSSSRGPVRDGRLKPEICALGAPIYSTSVYNTYVFDNGTSMAAPAVAGAAALLTERYKQLKGGQLPPAVLLKGLLTGCADDRGNPGPDYQWGFGMLNLRRAIEALEGGRYESRQVSPTQPNFTTTVAVPGGLALAKILLVWDDEPASPLAAKTLINDLNLTVIDPSGTVLKPLVLNPAQPASPAQPGTDTLNNIEQVVILTPVSGNYTVQVSGTVLSGTSLPTALVIDFVEKGIRLLQPAAGIPVAAGETLPLFWETPQTNGSFTLEYSVDNGSSWLSIGTATDTQRAFAWQVPVINTATARVRIRRGSDVADSGPFVMNQSPILTRSSSQCPGFFNISWTAVPNATGYEILRKKGVEMTPVDTVSGTSYALGGLPYDSIQYLAVRPLINGVRGYRSLAVWQRPDTARNCGAFANNDLALVAFRTPATGRVGTQTAFSASQQMALVVRNNGPVAAAYQIRYRFSGGSWQTALSGNIGANATDTALLPPQNLSAIGSYALEAAVINQSGVDPIASNDSLQTVFRQLSNPPVGLLSGYKSDFEIAPRITLTHDAAGLFDSSRWDYFGKNPGYGRLRTFVDTTILISGTKSISLDADRFFQNSTHALMGTFNLTGVDISNTEVRAEFDYMVHGISPGADSNAAYIRGSDSDSWVPLFVFDPGVSQGARRNSGSLSVTDVLGANGQRLSSSSAVLFVQNDSTVIAASNDGTGYTMDNFRLYSLGDDLALLSIDTPLTARCGLDSAVRLSITIANGTYKPQSRVPVSYRLDSGPVFTDTIAFFGPKDTLHFTFSRLLPIRDFEKHQLDVWVHHAPDQYPQNDSILQFTFQNQPLIASFPYLQHFESGTGGWYAEGLKSSWAWGTPQSSGIRSAASGTKAWKTGLAQGYNAGEKSYLYSPCFDIGAMAKPRLSFSLAYDFENCGNTFCDGAWLEWTTDSKTWSKLGLSVEGFNWYDSLQHRAWTGSKQFRWRVATIGLPTWVTGPIRLRFGMQADAYENREGIAIDDIHIYDAEGPVYNGAYAGIEQAVSATDRTVDFRKEGALVARLQNTSQDLGAVLIRDYDHPKVVDSYARQVYLPRSFVFQTQKEITSALPVSLYIPDADVVKMTADTSCTDCARAPDAYRLGILRYRDTARAAEDNLLSNNRDGVYQFQPFGTVEWIPYDSGYIARFQAGGTGELWFTAGNVAHSYTPENGTLSFSVTRTAPKKATIQIESRADARISRYEIYRSVAGKTTWEKIHETASRSSFIPVTYTAEDAPPALKGDTVLYRVEWIGRESGLRFRSGVQRLIWLEENTFWVYPNPAPGGHIHLQYSAPVGAVLKLQLSDLSGKMLFRKEVINTVFQTTLDLPLQLRPGVYLLRTEVDGQVRVERIVAL